VNPDDVVLGRLGMDVALFDDVVHQSPLLAEERECFYQLLSVVSQTDGTQLPRPRGAERDIVRMLRQPEEMTGRLCSVTGTARRAVQLQVEDADIRARLGIDHYYEIELFVPLDQNIRFVDAPGDAGKVFSNYPIVFCARRLPKNMPLGDRINVPVRVTGCYLKLWAYQTQFMSADSGRGWKTRLQLSPLLIGRQAEVLQTASSAENPYLGISVAGLFVLGLLAIWWGLWRSSLGDRRFVRSTLMRQFELKYPRTLEDLTLGQDAESTRQE
jgi:hypothetical protein